jgi:hypothetical protein
MPVSETEFPKGTALAVTAEALYIANLLLLPGLAFVILLVLYFRYSKSAPMIARAHLIQTMSASIWAGILLILVNVTILLHGGYEGPSTWAVVIIYFTVAHSSLVLFGMVGLSKAMAGQCWRYPFIGRPLPVDDQ